MITPYQPSVTLEELLAYNPEKEETFTASAIVNAVAKLLYTTNIREGLQIANVLKLDWRKLSAAIEVETGYTLKNLVVRYRLAQIKAFMKENPQLTNTEVGEHFGFPSPHAFWRFFQINTGLNPDGTKSMAPKVDNYAKMIKRHR